MPWPEAVSTRVRAARCRSGAETSRSAADTRRPGGMRIGGPNSPARAWGDGWAGLAWSDGMGNPGGPWYGWSV